MIRLLISTFRRIHAEKRLSENQRAMAELIHALDGVDFTPKHDS